MRILISGDPYQRPREIIREEKQGRQVYRADNLNTNFLEQRSITGTYEAWEPMPKRVSASFPTLFSNELFAVTGKGMKAI